jgi:hypothetical protein
MRLGFSRRKGRYHSKTRNHPANEHEPVVVGKEDNTALHRQAGRQVNQEIEVGQIRVYILLLLDTKLLCPFIQVMIPVRERAAGF